MSASKFTVGKGTTLSMATITAGTVGTYAAVAQTVDVSTPDSSVGSINVTNNDSPNNSKEYGPGMFDPGDAEFEVIFVAASHVALMGKIGDGIVYSWQVQFPDGTSGTSGTTCVFPGFLAGGNVETKTEDEADKGKIKIKMTGKPVWTAGT